uniref:Reverse transcriptase domain-containing protein n=1 Tax=Tanacetum cinerariifolium TaxID=118510 RepID=A0A699HHI6_TANCI|nr:reverse transcriptase domain-containing protein [Tanacetum cinerariifolium]
MLSSRFNPQEFFVPEKLLPPKEQVNYLTSSSIDLSNPSRKMPPKRTSTSTAPTMTQVAIQQLVADSVDAALEVQAANMANTDNTNRNSEPREAPVTRKLFSRTNCTKDYKVKFATATLTKEALSWWNSFVQPIKIDEAYKITWSEFKMLSIKKYCPRTKVKKMEDEFYN